jgi:hypothetical protein
MTLVLQVLFVPVFSAYLNHLDPSRISDVSLFCVPLANSECALCCLLLDGLCYTCGLS